MNKAIRTLRTLLSIPQLILAGVCLFSLFGEVDPDLLFATFWLGIGGWTMMPFADRVLPALGIQITLGRLAYRVLLYPSLCFLLYVMFSMVNSNLMMASIQGIFASLVLDGVALGILKAIDQA